MHDCKLRVKAKIDAKQTETEALERTAKDEVCRACGAVYSYGHFPSIKSVCKGRHGDSPSPMEGLNPHCLILELARRRSKRQAAIRARYSASEARNRKWEAKEHARLRAEGKWWADLVNYYFKFHYKSDPPRNSIISLWVSRFTDRAFRDYFGEEWAATWDPRSCWAQLD